MFNRDKSYSRKDYQLPATVNTCYRQKRGQKTNTGQPLTQKQAGHEGTAGCRENNSEQMLLSGERITTGVEFFRTIRQVNQIQSSQTYNEVGNIYLSTLSQLIKIRP